MSELSECTPDHFLASTADLVSLLAQFAVSRSNRSAQRRRHEQLAQAALYNLLEGSSPAASEPRLPTVAPNAVRLRGAQTAPLKKPRADRERSISVEPEDSPLGVRQRQHCRCGQCKWCLDNVRWERIFNEKFADPTYYGRLTVRHTSALAEAR
jgi:hypothetical protein